MDIQTEARPALGKTILVVGDDPSMRLICVKTLRAKGYTVIEAEGSSEAMKVLATHRGPVDLLLTDLMLPPPSLQLSSTENPYPRVHGHDVIQRTLTLGQASRVILMSSLSYHERKEYQPSIENLPFLQKPFSVEALMQVVDEVLAAAPLSPDDPMTKPTAKQDVRWYG